MGSCASKIQQRNSNIMAERESKQCTRSYVNRLPHNLFVFGVLRDDAVDDYAALSDEKNKILKDCIIPGQMAKIYGYKLYNSYCDGSHWDSAYIAKTGHDNDFVIGRILKYNGNDEDFVNKLTLIQNYKHCYHDGGRHSLSKDPNEFKEHTSYIVTNAYLMNSVGVTDNSKPISVVTFTTNIDNVNKMDKYEHIFSNDWMRQNIFNSQVKIDRHPGKGILDSWGGRKLQGWNCLIKSKKYYQDNDFVEWRIDILYKKGDIVCIDPEMRDYRRRGNALVIDKFVLWAMCMKDHISSELNQPQEGDIFTDLVSNNTLFFRIYLIEYITGWSIELSNTIINYCYKTNAFWWNGCGKLSFGRAECGYLVHRDYVKYCRACAYNKWDKSLKDKIESKKPNIGAIIRMNKYTINVGDHETMTRKDRDYDYGNVILKQYIQSQIELREIYNVLAENFNEKIEGLIKACIYKQKYWKYDDGGKDVKVNIRQVKLWGLYSLDNNKLLCALIWRYIHYKHPRYRQTGTLMFEILFLTTIGFDMFYVQRMMREIELYCIQNNYDVISVARLSGKNEEFWKSNGFRKEYDIVKKKDCHFGLGLSLRHNMLVFNDTDLYAKKI
eukprot:59346_1